MPDDVRADNVVHLLNGGYRDQLMMSQDRFCHLRGMNVLLNIVEVSKEEGAAMEKAMLDGTWEMPFTDIFEKFFPKLRQRGVSQADIDQIMDVNPGRFFSGKKF